MTLELEEVDLFDTLIVNYPDGVSINGLNMIDYEGSNFPAFTFVEDPTSYFNGVMALM